MRREVERRPPRRSRFTIKRATFGVAIIALLVNHLRLQRAIGDHNRRAMQRIGDPAWHAQEASRRGHELARNDAWLALMPYAGLAAFGLLAGGRAIDRWLRRPAQ